jgi:hypothetical protein
LCDIICFNTREGKVWEWINTFIIEF